MQKEKEDFIFDYHLSNNNINPNLIFLKGDVRLCGSYSVVVSEYQPRVSLSVGGCCFRSRSSGWGFHSGRLQFLEDNDSDTWSSGKNYSSSTSWRTSQGCSGIFFFSPPRGGILGRVHQEEGPDKSQDTLEGSCLSAGQKGRMFLGRGRLGHLRSDLALHTPKKDRYFIFVFLSIIFIYSFDFLLFFVF